MRLTRIKIRVKVEGDGKEPIGTESNFEDVCFELGTEYC